MVFSLQPEGNSLEAAVLSAASILLVVALALLSTSSGAACRLVRFLGVPETIAPGTQTCTYSIRSLLPGG